MAVMATVAVADVVNGSPGIGSLGIGSQAMARALLALRKRGASGTGNPAYRWRLKCSASGAAAIRVNGTNSATPAAISHDGETKQLRTANRPVAAASQTINATPSDLVTAGQYIRSAIATAQATAIFSKTSPLTIQGTNGIQNWSDLDECRASRHRTPPH